VKIAVLKEIREREHRVAVTPQVAATWVKQGIQVSIESGAGDGYVACDKR
jgi:NAD/NADP transhydrogenase alpha subunit